MLTSRRVSVKAWTTVCKCTAVPKTILRRGLNALIPSGC